MHSNTGKICGSCPSMPKNAASCGELHHPSPYLLITLSVLEKAPHTKWLGITIQSNLKWDVHCKQVAAKATNTLNVLKHNLKSMDHPIHGQEVHKKAYQSLVHPRSNMLPLYGISDMAQIERVQHGAAHYIHNTYSRYSSVTAMLQSLNWETLQSCRFNMCLCII